MLTIWADSNIPPPQKNWKDRKNSIVKLLCWDGCCRFHQFNSIRFRQPNPRWKTGETRPSNKVTLPSKSSWHGSTQKQCSQLATHSSASSLVFTSVYILWAINPPANPPTTVSSTTTRNNNNNNNKQQQQQQTATATATATANSNSKQQQQSSNIKINIASTFNSIKKSKLQCHSPHEKTGYLPLKTYCIKKKKSYVKITLWRNYTTVWAFKLKSLS